MKVCELVVSTLREPPVPGTNSGGKHRSPPPLPSITPPARVSSVDAAEHDQLGRRAVQQGAVVGPVDAVGRGAVGNYQAVRRNRVRLPGAASR